MHANEFFRITRTPVYSCTSPVSQHVSILCHQSNVNKTYRARAFISVHTKNMGEKYDLSDSVYGMFVGARWAQDFQKMISWDVHTQQSLQFTQNGAKKKPTKKRSSAGGNALLIRELRRKWTELWAARKDIVARRKASQHAQNIKPRGGRATILQSELRNIVHKLQAILFTVGVFLLHSREFLHSRPVWNVHWKPRLTR